MNFLTLSPLFLIFNPPPPPSAKNSCFMRNSASLIILTCAKSIFAKNAEFCVELGIFERKLASPRSPVLVSS